MRSTPLHSSTIAVRSATYSVVCSMGLTCSRECLLCRGAGDVKYVCSFIRKGFGRAVFTFVFAIPCTHIQNERFFVQADAFQKNSSLELAVQCAMLVHGICINLSSKGAEREFNRGSYTVIYACKCMNSYLQEMPTVNVYKCCPQVSRIKDTPSR